MKWLSHNNPQEEYNNENLYVKYGMILVGELGTFLSLRAIENRFSLEKPESSI